MQITSISCNHLFVECKMILKIKCPNKTIFTIFTVHNQRHNVLVTLQINHFNQQLYLTDHTWFIQPPPAYNALTWWRHQRETLSPLLAFVREIHRSPVSSPNKGQWRDELWCFIWCMPEQKAEQTVQMLVIWDAMALIVKYVGVIT